MTLVFVLAVILIVFVVGPLARAHADRLSRGGDPALPGAAQEMARLREEVDRLGAEVARLSEEQAFMVRLLAPGQEPPSEGSTASTTTPDPDDAQKPT